MELEDMKNLWQQYDQKLQENKMLNEHIIGTMIKDRSKNSLGKMGTLEYVNLTLYIILLLVYVAEIGNTGPTTALRSCYYLTFLIIITGMSFTFYKLQLISKFDFGMEAITETSHKLERLKLLIVKERVWGIALSPVILVAFYAIVNFWVHDVDMFEHFSSYAARIIIATVVAVAASLIIYRKVYFDNIGRIRENLDEIRKFRHDA